MSITTELNTVKLLAAEAASIVGCARMASRKMVDFKSCAETVMLPNNFMVFVLIRFETPRAVVIYRGPSIALNAGYTPL